MNILVTGANGYVGSHLLLYLRQPDCFAPLARRESGHKVWAVVRPSCPAHELALLAELKATVLFHDLEGTVGLDLQPGQIDAVIHLLGSLQAPAHGTFRSMHESKTQFLVAECRRLGVGKFIYLGTLGAARDAVSEYLRTKWLAEQEVRTSGLRYMILRSPLIFGKRFGARESKVIARLKELIRSRPRIPIIGNGKNLLQPIYIGDLVRCLERAAADPALGDETIDLGGPECVTFEGLVDLLAGAIGIQKSKIKIPHGVALAMAHVLPRLGISSPVTADQVRMMKQDVVADISRMQQAFGAPATTLGQGL